MMFTPEQEETVSRSNVVRDLRNRFNLGLVECSEIVNWVKGDKEQAFALAHDLVHQKTTWHDEYRRRLEAIEKRLNERFAMFEERITTLEHDRRSQVARINALENRHRG